MRLWKWLSEWLDLRGLRGEHFAPVENTEHLSSWQFNEMSVRVVARSEYYLVHHAPYVWIDAPRLVDDRTGVSRG